MGKNAYTKPSSLYLGINDEYHTLGLRNFPHGTAPAFGLPPIGKTVGEFFIGLAVLPTKSANQ
jgi:hypothetical protein